MSSNVKRKIDQYLLSVLKNYANPCLIELDQQGKLASWEGEPAHYGLPQPVTGMHLKEYLPEIADTIDPGSKEYMHIPLMQLNNGVPADMHVIYLNDHRGLLFLDASEEHDKSRERQQFINELQLLQLDREKLIKELEEARRISEIANTELHQASQHIAEKMGGEIEVESTHGKGSTFSVSVPARVANQATVEKNAAASRTKHVVLVAEDDPDIRYLIKLTLSGFNLRTIYCENGQEAVEKALKLNPDLILMDIKMPLMNGDDAVRQLRSNGYNKPIIALTAPCLRSEALECGCDNFIPKPIDMDFLGNAVTFMLSEVDSSEEE